MIPALIWIAALAGVAATVYFTGDRWRNRGR